MVRNNDELPPPPFLFPLVITRLLDNIQRMLATVGETLARWFGGALAHLFSQISSVPRSFHFAVLLLALVGVAHWVWFFSGPLALDFEDWPKERVYLQLLREAVATQTVPLHMDMSLQMTQRFLALPETMVAPHALLLPWFTEQQFIIFQCCLMFLIGLAGVCMLARRFDWNLFSFAAFTIVFAFNGFITCRLACGHFMWAGYYLSPWMLLATLRLLENPDTLRRWIELSWIVLALFLVGSFHIAVWWMLFLGVVALARPRLLLPVGAALALAGALCLFRIAPAAITFGGLDRDFGTGYLNLLELGRSLVVSQGYDSPFLQLPGLTLGWWEFNHFVGLPAAAFALVYALKRPALSGSADLRANRYSLQTSASPLLIAAGVLFIFSLSDFYAPICSLPIPLINSERVTTRFISVAFFVVLFLACTRFSRESPRLSAGWQALAIGLLAQTAIELFQHSSLWRPVSLEATHEPSAYWENSSTMVAHIAHFTQENKYKLVVAASWTFSGLTFLASFVAWLRLRVPAASSGSIPV